MENPEKFNLVKNKLLKIACKFGDENNVTLKICTRISNNYPDIWFSCHFDDVEILEDRIFLVSTSGHGITIEEAMEDYLNTIMNKTLVYRAWSDGRVEIVANME